MEAKEQHRRESDSMIVVVAAVAVVASDSHARSRQTWRAHYNGFMCF
jgi:hypothetical protein